MSGGAKKLLHAAAGTAASGGNVYIEDVFGTFLYEGDTSSSSRKLTTGLDFDDKGGLAWFKRREEQGDPVLFDTERSGLKYLIPNRNNAEAAQGSPADFISFNSDGVNIGQNNPTNSNNKKIVLWQFLKQEGFFDIVTFSTTGSGGTQAISHNLGSIPGYIVIKKISAAQSWFTWHKSVTSPNSDWWRNFAGWEATDEFYDFGDDSGINAAPTDSTVTLGTYFTNATADYVAYFFAEGGSGDQIFGDDGDEAIIKCGAYDGNGTTNGTAIIDLAFEPQWVLVKRIDGGGHWIILDNMRGINHELADASLVTSSNAAEDGVLGAASLMSVRPTGFALNSTSINANSQSYMYVAIRRGPMKEPDAGTEVFSSVELTANEPGFKPGFPVDWGFYHSVSSTGGGVVSSRLIPKKYLQTTTTAALANLAEMEWDYSNGWYSYATDSANTLGYSWRRQPKVFDVIVYKGNATAPMDVKHNLGVAPELLIFKKTSATEDWNVLNSVGSGSYNNTGRLFLNKTDAYSNTGWGGTLGSATAITVNTSYFLNQSGVTYQVLLFASLAGVSAVNEYSGTGNDLNVTDLGASARFVMIKRIDTTGDWYVFDTIQTFTASEAKYWTTNGGAQVASTSYVEPHSSGFTVTSSAPAGLNADGGTYLYLAFS